MPASRSWCCLGTGIVSIRTRGGRSWVASSAGGCWGALAKHLRMEITAYSRNISAFLNRENKKRKGKKGIFFLPPGRSSYLIPEDCFSVCAIFVAGSALSERASSAENLREIHYERRRPKVELGHRKLTTTCFAASKFDLPL